MSLYIRERSTYNFLQYNNVTIICRKNISLQVLVSPIVVEDTLLRVNFYQEEKFAR